MTPETYARLGALEIARLVAAREVGAREVLAAALARIEATEPHYNAFVHVDREGALRAAEALDRALAAGEVPGPLAGVPVSVKDLVHVAGMPTSSGSAVFAGTMAHEDAAPVARLRRAGAIIVGKTTTPEFGHKPITASPLFGQTLNPWNRAFTSGGSSGGAAVSVAARQVPIAIGTDGGGSIRIPASVCGVLGLKPTLGRVPHVHAPDLFGNNSYIGPMACRLDDLAVMQRVMEGPDGRDPWSRGFVAAEPSVPTEPAGGASTAHGGMRIGYALTVGNPRVEPQVAQAFERAIATAEAGGFRCEPIDIDLARSEPAFRVMLESALASRLAARMATDRARFDASLVTTVENGLRRSGPELASAQAMRTTLYREVESLLSRFDLLVTPTLSQAALAADTDPHAEVIIDGTASGPIRAGWYPYTFPFNLTGHPALSMPCGWTTQGLPIGLQLVAAWGAEQRLLTAAASLAGGLRHEERDPPV